MEEPGKVENKNNYFLSKTKNIFLNIRKIDLW